VYFGEIIIIIIHEVGILCLTIHFGCFERFSSIHSAVWDGYQDDKDCNGQIPFACPEEIKHNQNRGQFGLTCAWFSFSAPEMTGCVGRVLGLTYPRRWFQFGG
jgi:hypothetical protein